jgi:hypothetical protein
LEEALEAHIRDGEGHDNYDFDFQRWRSEKRLLLHLSELSWSCDLERVGQVVARDSMDFTLVRAGRMRGQRHTPLSVLFDSPGQD